MTLAIGAGEMQTTGHRPPATELTVHGGEGGQFFHLKVLERSVFMQLAVHDFSPARNSSSCNVNMD